MIVFLNHKLKKLYTGQSCGSFEVLQAINCYYLHVAVIILFQVLSEVMVNQFEIVPENQPIIMKYIQKCLELCWMMNMHSDPIFLKFEEVKGLAIFDRKTYKPYLDGGKYLDFIVWPPVYAYEGGKLIAKGIAEGKEN